MIMGPTHIYKNRYYYFGEGGRVWFDSKSSQVGILAMPVQAPHYEYYIDLKRRPFGDNNSPALIHDKPKFWTDAHYINFCKDWLRHLESKTWFTPEVMTLFVEAVAFGFKYIKGKDYKRRAKIKPSLRFNILKRDGYRCQICGRSGQDGVVLEVDHKHPVVKGGNSSLDNLWTLCFNCNRGKSAEDL